MNFIPDEYYQIKNFSGESDEIFLFHTMKARFNVLILGWPLVLESIKSSHLLILSKTNGQPKIRTLIILLSLKVVFIYKGALNRAFIALY